MNDEREQLRPEVAYHIWDKDVWAFSPDGYGAYWYEDYSELVFSHGEGFPIEEIVSEDFEDLERVW